MDFNPSSVPVRPKFQNRTVVVSDAYFVDSFNISRVTTIRQEYASSYQENPHFMYGASC